MTTIFSINVTEELKHSLWMKFKDGDNDALSKLYTAFANDLYAYGIKITKDEHLVKDCIQEVFIQLIERKKVLLITSRIHIYLFKSLRNRILEELRSNSKKADIIGRLSEKDHEDEQNAEQLMINSEEENSIRKTIGLSISKLPNRQREIVYLKYTEGFSYDEIAEMLGIDKASARTLLYRSLKSIKEQLSHKILVLVAISKFFFYKYKPDI